MEGDAPKSVCGGNGTGAGKASLSDCMTGSQGGGTAAVSPSKTDN